MNDIDFGKKYNCTDERKMEIIIYILKMRNWSTFKQNFIVKFYGPGMVPSDQVVHFDCSQHYGLTVVIGRTHVQTSVLRK